MGLDLSTLQIVLIASHVLTTLIILMNWKINPQVPGAREWALGRFLVSGALLVFALQHLMPLWLIVGLGNLMVFSGYYITWLGTRYYMGLRVFPHWPFGVIIAAMAIAHFYLVYVLESTSLMLAIVTIVYSLSSAFALFSRKTAGFVSARFLGMTLTGYALFYVWVAFYNQFIMSGTVLIQNNVLTQATYFSGILFSSLTALFYISMTAEHLNANLKRQAERDPLTGAMNRRAFYNVAEQAWAAHLRAGDALSILVVDLDHFKQINDRYGHAVGDRVLCHAVDMFAGQARDQDVLARFGGEEFVILCPATNLDGATSLAERMQDFMAQHPWQDENGLTVTVTASIGIAVNKADNDMTLDMLINQADMAVYDAKAAGRDQVVIASMTA